MVTYNANGKAMVVGFTVNDDGEIVIKRLIQGIIDAATQTLRVYNESSIAWMHVSS